MEVNINLPTPYRTSLPHISCLSMLECSLEINHVTIHPTSSAAALLMYKLSDRNWACAGYVPEIMSDN